MSGALDRWAEWLVRTRYEGYAPDEVETLLAELERVRDRVLERARISPGDTVVDVGAGTGLLAVGALEHVGDDGDVVAIDPSVDCLEELRRGCPDARLWYLLGEADVLPLPDATTDVVLTRSVLIYVRDKNEAACATQCSAAPAPAPPANAGMPSMQ